MIPTVLITGGSRGIGAAAVRKFAAMGWNVCFTYLHSAGKAASLEEEMNRDRPCCEALPCDVSDCGQVDVMRTQALNRFGRIDVLVNNAGVSSVKLFQDTGLAEIEHLFGVNVYGTFNVTRAFLPEMISRKAGVIVNVSSVWGIMGASCEVVYSSAKAAVIGFTKALSLEVGPSGIRVNCVAPGAIATDMLSCFRPQDLISFAEETSLGRLGTADEIAEAIYFLSSESSSYLTGQVLSPNGGIV